MKKVILILSILLLQLGCSSNEDEKKSYPECLNSEINTILQSPPANPRATIKKYTYQNQTVYEVNPHFADGKTSIYNERCELVCTNGGIDGGASGSCINWNNSTLLESVWTDPR